MDLPQRFPYRGRLPLVLWPAAFFGFGTMIIANEAMRRVGLGAVLSWTLTFLSGLYTLMGLVPVIRWITPPCPMLEVGTDRIVLPYGFFHKKTKQIDYANIYAIHEERYRGQTVLIVHAQTDFGKITASLLPNMAAYTAIKNFL